MKKLILLISFLFAINAQAQDVGVSLNVSNNNLNVSRQSSGMTGQIIGNGPTQNTGLTRYLGLSAGGAAWNSTEATVRQVMPISGSITTSRFCLSGASGTGSRAFTIRKNGSDTTQTATITNATCATDTVNSVSFVAGDLVDIKQVTTGTLNSTRAMWAIKILAANSNEFPLLMGTLNQVGAGQTRYHDLQGDSGGQFTEQYTEYVFPTAGTVSKLYVKTDTNAVTSTIVTTLRVNSVDTDLTASIAAGESAQSDTSNSVAVIAGDRATIKFVNNGSASLRATVGMKFAPTVDGESIGGYNSNSNLSQATTQYSTAMGGGIALDSTEANIKQLVLAGTMKKLRGATYANVGGSGQTMTATARLNGADSALTCIINTGAKACSDTSDTVTLANDDMVNFGYTNSATTGANQPFASMVLTTTP